MDASDTYHLFHNIVVNILTIMLLGRRYIADIVNIADGAVLLEIEADKLKDKNARLARLNRIFGAWRNQLDIDKLVNPQAN